MAGLFELFVDAESHFRFRLKGPDGTVVAVSKAFDDKPAAVAGIAAVRECAGTGLITDLGEAGQRDPASSVSASQARAMNPSASRLVISAGVPRRYAAPPRRDGPARPELRVQRIRNLRATLPQFRRFAKPKREIIAA
ncbi:MAG: uncharacterized protein QOH40_2984 [Arthrobacter pascens]|nr:uncharacterized protein [Arthrobacter pascens]